MQNHKIMTHENIELRCSSNFMGSLLKTSLVINFSSHVILMAFSPKQPGSVYHSFHNLFSNRLGQISFQISLYRGYREAIRGVWREVIGVFLGYFIYRVFIKYCVFSEHFKIYRTLVFLCFNLVLMCVHTQGR